MSKQRREMRGDCIWFLAFSFLFFSAKFSLPAPQQRRSLAAAAAVAAAAGHCSLAGAALWGLMGGGASDGALVAPPWQ